MSVYIPVELSYAHILTIAGLNNMYLCRIRRGDNLTSPSRGYHYSITLCLVLTQYPYYSGRNIPAHSKLFISSSLYGSWHVQMVWQPIVVFLNICG